MSEKNKKKNNSRTRVEDEISKRGKKEIYEDYEELEDFEDFIIATGWKTHRPVNQKLSSAGKKEGHSKGSHLKDSQKKNKTSMGGGSRNNKNQNKASEDREQENKKKDKSTEYWTGKDKANKLGGACTYRRECGGCNILSVSYEKHLAEKQKEVEGLLKRYCRVEPILGMEKPEHYRNKVHVVFDHDRKGNPISGVYEEGTHRVIPVEKCLIHNEKADAIIASIRGMLKSFKILTYDEDTGYGLLRHVLIRTGYHSGEILVVLVLGSPILPSKKNFVKALLKEHPEITSIVINVNDKKTSMVLGEKEQVIYGKGYIEDTLCGLSFRISPKSFYQVNPVQTELLYQKAIELAKLSGKETLLDAYCGIGTIGLIASKHVKKVIGVELNKDAVRDAITNAKHNHADNIEFYQNDAGVFLSQMAAAGDSVDVVIMDPPRSGSTAQFLDAVAAIQPKKVVYISCNPVTLERDLEYMTKKGYKAEIAVPVDMFPWTVHVETVCLLSKLNTEHHIEVDLELDELDLTSSESKATYEEIKNYVLKTTGLKVSSLYISQVKRKLGLEVGVCYNLPKSDNARVPECPVEKETAITAALKHFEMI
jgi:23S rRNA (uracil1939-C5)-methyltransferase